MEPCPECGYTPKSTVPRRWNAAVTYHRRAKHGVLAEGTVAECHHDPQHPHGSNHRYVNDGCRCAKCREKNRIRSNRRRREVAYGRWDRGYVPAGPVREHLEALRAGGMTLRQMVELSGAPLTVIRDTLSPGRRVGRTGERITRRNAEKILAVKPTADPHSRVVPVTGTMRRIRALTAIGWTYAQQAARCGTNPRTFMFIAAGRVATVERSTEERVRAMYDELWDKPADPEDQYLKSGSVRALKAAERKGWPPPLAWDDDTIDDPDTEPLEVRRAPAKRYRNRDAVVEDLDWLHRTGVHPDVAARRLGMSRRALEQAARRVDRQDLANWIVRKDVAA
jgi:hypothetical protein